MTLFFLIDVVVSEVRNVTCLNPLPCCRPKGERLGEVTGRQYNARNSDVFLPRVPHGLGGGGGWVETYDISDFGLSFYSAI